MTAVPYTTGTTTGTTFIEMLPAPGGTTTREIRTLIVANLDTASMRPIIRLNIGARSTKLWDMSQHPEGIIPGDSWVLPNTVRIWLPSPDMSLCIALSAAVTATEADWYISWEDNPSG